MASPPHAGAAGARAGSEATTMRAVRQDRRPAMGGTAAITVVGGPPGLVDDCFALLDELEQAWSRFLDTSDVWRLNWAQGRPVQVRSCTVRLVRELIRAWALTDGAFDPTTLPQLVAAGYATSSTDPTRTTMLPDTATWPGSMTDIDIDGPLVRLSVGTTLDPGGLGKGLASDMLTEFVLDRGADGVLVEVGGDLVVAGAAPDGGAWTIGIEDPFTGELLTVVRLTRGAVATSSRLVRMWTGATGPAHHLIDPATGVSAVTSTVTATVVAGSGARAEALTKLAFVGEPEALLGQVPRLGGAALVLSADRRQRRSVNWSDFE
ncbi:MULTISPECIES: FAD:protein FMN transferase [unclassified Rhodococcus (in: high G+C Gram-positive bacteria)]|uniref:FAD:protein FMN transferase n=1 Tax=unclassified Rhodococcus (in: high G+C Gram-positive bacteria) TaxID=192944 RepID=UPI001E4C7EA5|nr:FAD:protein FMN transferase [Rhodococcus sp. M8]